MMIKGQDRKRSGDEPCSIVTAIYSISSRCKKVKKKQENKNNAVNEITGTYFVSANSGKKKYT